jgi:hypothetical protein
MTRPAYYLERPSRDNAATIRAYTENVASGKEDARYVAQLAVMVGFMLIGTTTSKQVHYPVAPEQHTYNDLVDMSKKTIMTPEAIGRKTLQAGYQSDVAIISGLLGDLNDRKQRHARATALGLTLGAPECRYGWGLNLHKSRAVGFVPREDACVSTHASPAMITAALNADNPFTGAIDIVYPHPSCVRIAHDIGQYLMPVARRTIATIPLISNIDLPFDIVPTSYKPLQES